ncbi:protein TusC [Marinibactrum halimedae]|uniref:Protein TusC n=2 Tax=Marinibactrum halimedae TaxID=1444977 RepID=A0AA37T464_9GAMM|nr:protein TusC [Marinibactrum halimedae]
MAKEGLDAILAASAYGQHIQVLFMDEGVFQLLRHQSPKSLSLKSPSNLIETLPIYGITDLYVCEDSLTKRAINEELIMPGTQCLSKEDIKHLIATQDAILNF